MIQTRLVDDWSRQCKQSTGAFKIWGKPRFHYRNIFIRVGKNFKVFKRKRISEQFSPVLKERNLHITDYHFELNIWFSKYGVSYVVLKSSELGTYSTDNTRMDPSQSKIELKKVPHGFKITGYFTKGKNYTPLKSKVPFTIWVSSEEFTLATTVASSSRASELTLPLDNWLKEVD